MEKEFDGFYDEIKNAKKKLVKVVTNRYPVGSKISWSRGKYVQSGTVLHLPSYGIYDRVQVRNDNTGAELWIHAYDIVESES